MAWAVRRTACARGACRGGLSAAVFVILCPTHTLLQGKLMYTASMLGLNVPTCCCRTVACTLAAATQLPKCSAPSGISHSSPCMPAPAAQEFRPTPHAGPVTMGEFVRDLVLEQVRVRVKMCMQGLCMQGLCMEGLCMQGLHLQGLHMAMEVGLLGSQPGVCHVLATVHITACACLSLCAVLHAADAQHMQALCS